MGLKSKIANRVLNAKLASLSRDKKVVNLDTANSAGIYWEVGQDDVFNQLCNELIAFNIDVTGLCYFPQKKSVIPEGVNGFTRKQTSWWLEIPKAKLVDEFTRTKFDLLIDLTVLKSFPGIYVAALSEAVFKVGYSGNSVNYFDLNIDFREQPETGQLASQVLYYLKRINKTTLE